MVYNIINILLIFIIQKNDRTNNELGMKRFKELQEKDEIKNNAALEICSGKKCLRIYDFFKRIRN